MIYNKPTRKSIDGGERRGHRVDWEKEVVKRVRDSGELALKGGLLHIRTEPYLATQHICINCVVTYCRRTMCLPEQ